MVTAALTPQAATFPENFLETQVASGLTSPTCLAFGDDGRIFIAEQQGKIHMVHNGVRLAEPWAVVDVDPSDERGLTNIAVDPDFATNHYLYVYYTAKTPNVHQRLSRFISNGDVAQPGSETILLELPELTGGIWHFGGAMHFASDGKLYLTVGDYEKSTLAQDITSPLGKVLRLNRDGTFPTDNPYYAGPTDWASAVWALGFRHPFSAGMQPGTDKLFVNDVGQGSWEEVNEVTVGGNHVWPAMEGNAGTTPTGPGTYHAPIYTYSHGDGCASIGGDFYNPTTASFPEEYVGDYFTMDFCNGWVRRIRPDKSIVPFATGLAYPTRLKFHDGDLYYLSRGNRNGPILPGAGSLYRVRYSVDPLPHITEQPQDQKLFLGETLLFDVEAIGPGPLTYQWQKDGANIASATASTLRIASASASDAGNYRLIVSNAAGSDTSRLASVAISSGRPPIAEIFTPWEGFRWTPGQTVAYSGKAVDAQGNAMPASAFTWRVDFHHETHFHAFLPEQSGATQGSFTLPDLLPEPNTWYRVHLRLSDADGFQTSVFRDIFPADGASRQFFVSDTTWTSSSNGWGPVERDRSNGEQGAADGHTQSLEGKLFAKGLGVHSPSEIRIPLNGQCLLFMAEAGLDDEVGNLGSAAFEVWGDDNLLYRSSVRTGADRIVPIEVPVAGVSELKLVTTDGGNGPGYDHADWGNARLACRHPEPLVDVALPFSSLRFEEIANGWGPVERNRSNGENKADDGNTLAVAGQTYATGLGVHAGSEVHFNMGGECSEFQSDIGLDDEVGNQGSVVFEIWGDDERLYQSPVLTGASPRTTATANLSGRQVLRLLVTDAGNGNGHDHADWAGAQITCKSYPPYPVQRYLSDLTPTSTTNGWGPYEKDRSNGEQSATDGRTLTVDRLTYAKGLGVHAPSDLRYNLNGACQEFRADLGLDDEVSTRGSVVFEVWGDNTRLYQSPVLTGNSVKTGIQVNVSGRSQLRLVVTEAGNGVSSDHADWANARVTCSGAGAP